jgi:DNA replication and repair protein RecF
MFIESLRLRNFRNYEKLELDFHRHVNVFIGQNGQGKSNILEALEYTISGHSFRSVHNDQVIKNLSEPHESKVIGVVNQRDLKKEIELHLFEKKTEIKFNGKKVSRDFLQKNFCAVVFTPDSLSVVKQGPQERRNLLDQIAKSIAIEKSKIPNDFARCLKTRNRVLKERLDGTLSKREADALLESINHSFLPLATELVTLRLETINELILPMKKAFSALLTEGSVDISVEYVISGKSAIDWSQNQVYDALKTRLQELQVAELSSSQSLVGPHKHDVRFLFNGKDARTFCSQGQQRAITLAFKIAQILKYFEIKGEYPLLLLDDVFSELDFEKRENLMRMLSDTPAQIFLTTTELDEQIQFGKKEVKVFEITRGQAR